MSDDITAHTKARLRAAIRDFDGKAMSLLCEAKVQLRDTPGFWDALYSLTNDEEPLIQAGSTWLVQQSLKCGDLTLAGIAMAVTPRLGELTHWGAILHMLQALDACDRPLPEGPALARFAQTHITHTRPFVRAWAINALCVLAIHHPEFREAAETARDNALNDTAASVRARAHNAPEAAMGGH